jgi:two-component sensor histidine kinase
MDTQGNMRMVWALATGNTLLYCTAFFCPLTFYMTSDNQFVPGPLSLVAYVISALFLAQVVALAIRIHRVRREPDTLLPVLAVFIFVVSSVVDTVLGFDYTSRLQIATMTTPLAADCFFTWLHMEIAYEYEQARLENQRTQLAVSQIQPHFLYNTLSTIQSLCLSDPEAAARTTEELAVYLRQNLNALSQSGLIPFSQELEHTRTYAQIEMTRFPHIEVTYQIDDSDFMLPVLSVQPLVENAIRHGVRIREHGIVRVRSYVEKGMYHVVEVRDNGKGFDVGTLADQDNDEHIGIYNVRQRVRGMCGGDLRIKSVVGEGTCATLLIPIKGDTP